MVATLLAIDFDFDGARIRAHVRNQRIERNLPKRDGSFGNGYVQFAYVIDFGDLEYFASDSDADIARMFKVYEAFADMWSKFGNPATCPSLEIEIL